MVNLKIPVIILLILALLMPFAGFPPDTASAQTDDVIIGGVSCVAGGVASPWLMGYVNKGLNAVKNALSGKVESWLGLTNTVPVIDQEVFTKERIYDLISRCFAREILNAMTGRMIGAVRTSGRDGGPAFVRNWRNFKLTAQRRGENIFRSILGSTELCPYISGDIKSLFRADGQPNSSFVNSRVNNLDPYAFRARCTMPYGWNIDNYKSDFSGNGGWDALSRLSQPQNNFYGNLLMSLGEVSLQRNAEEESDTASVIAGLGFDSRRGRSRAENCRLAASNGQCIVYKDILTPGSILQQSTSNVIQQELAWVTNVDELNELVSTLTELMISRVLNLAKPDLTPQESFPREIYPGGRQSDFDLPVNPDSGSSGPAPEPEPIPIPDPLTACIQACIQSVCGQPDPYCVYQCGGDPVCTQQCTTSICQSGNPQALIDCANSCYAQNGGEDGGGGGGTGTCADQGGTINHAGALQTGIDAVNAANPGGIADALNTWENALAYLNEVVAVIRGSGLNATTNVKNGNDNPNRGDLIAIWGSGDSAIERYDAVDKAGAIPGTPDSKPMRQAAHSGGYTGDIPLSCTN